MLLVNKIQEDIFSQKPKQIQRRHSFCSDYQNTNEQILNLKQTLQSQSLKKSLSNKNLKQLEEQKQSENQKDLPICLICYEDIEEINKLKQTCQCKFHNDCVKRFIVQQLYNGINEVQCPGCDIQLKLEDFHKLFFPELKPNHNVIKCPKISCSRLISYNKNTKKNIKCRSCKIIICLKCKKNAHPKVPCDLVAKCKEMQCKNPKCKKIITFSTFMQEKNMQCPFCNFTHCMGCGFNKHGHMSCEEYGMDDGIFEIIKSNKYKMCPGCYFFVEKSSGCNHMTCKCGHEFCYQCGKNYKGHNYGQCIPN